MGDDACKIFILLILLINSYTLYRPLLSFLTPLFPQSITLWCTATLKIGDYVDFRSVSFDFFLSADGILNDSLQLSDDETLIDSNIFCIHLKRQYSAQSELDDFVEKYGEDPKQLQDVEMQRYLSSLKVSYLLPFKISPFDLVS